jgi:membrane fusion protein, epimerase transport system
MSSKSLVSIDHFVVPTGVEVIPPSDSMLRAAIAGWAVLAVFFGGFGTWAATAPLHGAVVASAVVKVEGNRKSLQHLDGGIVKELRVKEGDKVAAATILVVLDDTQARAELDVLAQQLVVLRATEARLMAEMNRDAKLALPEDLKRNDSEPYVTSIWSGQVQQFDSRRAALEGQRRVIAEKIGQLQHQIVGSEAQAKAYHLQLNSVRSEAASIASLVEKGLIARPRILQLERLAAGLEGQIAEAMSSAGKSRQAIAEQQQLLAQLDNDRLAEVTKDLRDVQAKLLDVVPRLTNARAVLGRMDIRAPYSGEVVGLNVFSVGGVIGRGEKILEIVPEKELLLVEAQIAVEDISEVRPGMRAEVHLTSFKQRQVPIIHGDVLQISADRLVEQRTGAPYYVVSVRLDEGELAQLPNIQLYPGMPATLMIPTEERTALDYLLGPLVQSFNQSFRQR